MEAVKLLVVEDEPLIAAQLEAILQDLGYSVCDVVDNGLDCMTAIAKHHPDLVLLDINLGDAQDGVEIAARIRDAHGTPFVFVTSHSDKGTLERVKATDPAGFIVKPFDERTVSVQVELALARKATGGNAYSEAPESTEQLVLGDSIFVKDKGRLVKVKLADIIHAEADDNYTVIHTASQKFLISATLKAVEEKLTHPDFLRVHRSHLINVPHVTALEEGYVFLGKVKVPVGKSHKDELMARVRTL